MKTMLRSAWLPTLALVTLLVTLAPTAALADTKPLGVIDSDRIAKEYPAARDAQERYEQFIRELQREVEEKERELQLRADELEGLFTGWGCEIEPWAAGSGPWPECSVAPDLGTALEFLAETLEPGDDVLVTGSCFTVAETLHRLGFGDLEETRTVRPAAAVLQSMGKDSS